jgi:methylmalonyl-CoA mutase C-terminal domain/subunit
LRDAGFEVIYLGLFQTAESIAKVAVDEDVDAVGLSILSGAHGTLFPDVVAMLRSVGLQDVIVFGGGVIPADDIPALAREGVARIFTPGARLAEICAWLGDTLDRREAEAS